MVKLVKKNRGDIVFAPESPHKIEVGDRLLICVESFDPKYIEEVGWHTQPDRLVPYDPNSSEMWAPHSRSTSLPSISRVRAVITHE